MRRSKIQRVRKPTRAAISFPETLTGRGRRGERPSGFAGWESGDPAETPGRRSREVSTYHITPPSMANGSNLGEPRQSCTTQPSSNTADVMIKEKNTPSAVATHLTGTKLLPKKTTATKHATYPTASSWSVIATFRRARPGSNAPGSDTSNRVFREASVFRESASGQAPGRQARILDLDWP